MRVLLIHNKYQQKGGEDVVYAAEGELLERHGHLVERLLFDNSQIKSATDTILSGIGSLYNPKSAGLVEKIIKEFKPEVIHVHNFFPLASPSVFFVAAKHHIPVVVTLHNYRLICPSYTLYYKGKIYEESIHKIFPVDAVLKGVYRDSKIQTASTILMTGMHKLLGTWKNKVNRFIVLTHFAKNTFYHSSLHLPQEKFVVKPNFTEDLGSGVYPRENFFLFIGRLTEEKGIDTLLACAALTKATIKIIGDGPMRETVEKQASLHKNIEYLGFRNKDFIIGALKQCKALLFPSVWYEGFPMTILEAFSCGTPVICSRLGGPAEIVQDQVTGLHFTAGDARDLAQKISLISEEANLTEVLGKHAREIYLQQFTPEVNYSQLLEIYSQVINNK